MILTTKEIKVSNWYWSKSGLIIEDYYPLVMNQKIFTQICEVATKLDELGFKNPNLARDMLLNENNEVVYIDFGFDLGYHPTLKNTNYCFNNFINQYSNYVI